MDALSGLLVGLFGGLVAYMHVTDSMRLPHETGIAVALVTAIVCASAVYLFLYSPNSGALAKADKRKRYRR